MLLVLAVPKTPGEYIFRGRQFGLVSRGGSGGGA